MINNEFLKVLKNINPITDKVLLKYPITTINSESVDIIANIDLEKLGVESFPDTGIYDLSKFLSLLDLFKDFEVKRLDDRILIESRTNSAVFTLADILLLNPFDKSKTIIERLNDFPTVAEFKLTKTQMSQIKKASSIFNELNSLNFVSEDNNIDVKLNVTNRFESSNNTFKINYLKCSNKNFNINIDINNFNKLPNEDFLVKIKYNDEKDAYRILFESEGGIIKIVIALTI